MQLSVQTSAVSSTMFLTANHPNPLTSQLAADATGTPLTWPMWASAASVPGRPHLPAFSHQLPRHFACTPLSCVAVAVCQKVSCLRGDWYACMNVLIWVQKVCPFTPEIQHCLPVSVHIVVDSPSRGAVVPSCMPLSWH